MARQKDIPWERKINKAIWRGVMTGNVVNSPNATDLTRCRSNERCRFVLDHASSELIDARLTDHFHTEKRYRQWDASNGRKGWVRYHSAVQSHHFA